VLNACLLALALAAALPKASRCQLLHAILGVPHSAAKVAFRDLECVRQAVPGKRLPIRAAITDEGTRPVLAPGESCPQGYIGADPRRMSRSRTPQSYIELRFTARSDAEMSFSVLLETWGSTTRAVSCGASGEGVVVRENGAWRVRD
jgi:hypothetical protein